MFYNRTCLFSWLLSSTCVFWCSACVVTASMCGSEQTELNIRAVHYASKGYRRWGISGHGTILDYVFGSTNTCTEAAIEVSENYDRFLCTTNEVAYKSFNRVTLYHDMNSHRLFRVELSCVLPVAISSSECIALCKSLSADCDYWYDLKIPVPVYADVKDYLVQREGQLARTWNQVIEDTCFVISLSLAPLGKNAVKIRLVVESKKIRRPSVVDSFIRNDVEVKINDL